MKAKQLNEIAIIGVGFELPQRLENKTALWQFLLDQREAVVEIPSDRWNIGHFYDPVDRTPGKTTMRWGNFLSRGSCEFDPLFFGISPREGMMMDFQQRLLLAVSWRLMENAGILPANLQNTRTGVFIGGFTQDHLVQCGSPYMRAQIRDQFAATAAPMTMLAARLAHVYGLQGPAMSIDTACSSSLVAIAQACNGLILGDCDLAFAGGVNFMLSPQTAMLMTKGHFLAKDGRSKSFDASADGYGRGEGCVLFALKRLKDALCDGDNIHGVISSSGVNQDGRTPVLTMPSAQSQEALITEVMAKAGITPDQISYVEAHGTGTAVGDPIEAQAIGQAIGSYLPNGRKVLVGAIKANLGHTEAAAGALGVLKAVLCLEHRLVPPQANLHELNPAIPFEDYKLEIPYQAPVPLPVSGTLYGLVNSFGYGGTNAVALLRSLTKEERESAQCALGKKPGKKRAGYTGILGRIPLIISAFSEKSLQALARSYASFIENDTDKEWQSLCFSAAMYRTRFRYRAVILPHDRKKVSEEALKALQALEKGVSHPALYTGEAATDRTSKPVFVFSGMGPQWWGMGRAFLKNATGTIKRLSQDCDREFQAMAGWSVLEELFRPEEESRIQETHISQPAIFLLQICLAAFFRKQGIEPGAVTGHSVGEVAAAYVSGALDLANAVKVIYHRSRLQARLEGKGKMLAVGLSADILKEKLDEYEGRVCIAAVNAPQSCTLAGNKTDLEKLAAEWNEEEIFARFLNVELPYHSPFMEEIRNEFLTSLSDLKSRKPLIPLYSTATGKRWDQTNHHDASYWYQNARDPVLFLETMRSILQDDYAVFLEIAAHPVLSPSLKACAEESRHNIAICASLKRGADDQETLTKAMIDLMIGGSEPDWCAIMASSRVELPTYKWQIEDDLWQEVEAARRDRLDMTVHPVLGTPSLNAGKSWQADITAVIMPWLVDHTIDGVTLFPAAAYIEAALAAHYQIESMAPAILEDFRLKAPLVLQEGVVPVMAWCFDEESRIVTFTSETMAFNGDWQVHGQVTLLQAKPWEKAHSDVRALCQTMTRIEGADVYKELSDYGMNYGPAFQTLATLYRGEGVSIGEVVLKEAEKAELERYFIHPALLDGALHAVIGAFQTEGNTDSLFVPTEIRRLSYMGQKCASVTVIVKFVAQSKERIEADLTLYSNDGDVVVEILGLKCRRLARTGRDDETRIGRFLFSPSWVLTEKQPLLNEPQELVLIGKNSGLSGQLKSLLDKNGIEVYSYSSPEEAKLDAVFAHNKKLLELDAIVYLPEPEELDVKKEKDNAIGEVQKALSLVNRIPACKRQKPVTLIVVTRGAYAAIAQEEVLPSQRAIASFFRAVQIERSDLSVRFVDVPLTIRKTLLEDLAAELVMSEASEDSVALYGDKRFVERLVKTRLNTESEVVPFETLEGSQNGRLGVRLQAGSVGTFESLNWQAYEVPTPGPGEVTLKTHMAGLNFKDILKAMSLLPESVIDGTYNGDHLGMESVVEVVAVGEGVTDKKIGDLLVFVYPESFSLYRVCSENILQLSAFPINMEILSYGKAALAGAPVVFVTAYYGLVELARLKKGETVLIHAGAGGVGQAAIQIAQMQGATIYATAGSEEKRDYLRQQGCAGVWDSRTLEFVDGVRQATNGRGVDVVLNSLSGEALTHSLSLVAPMGRFVEIGKRDIVEHRRLDLTPFNENLSFFSFDLDRIMPDKRFKQFMVDILQRAREQTLNFLPHKIFPASEVSEAFRYMASSKHIGKVILSFEDLSKLKAHPVKKKQPSFKKDGAYLITGGMGGFGLKTTMFLLRQGAGVLHLVGRHMPVSPDAQKAFEDLKKAAEALGAVIEVHLLDVTDEKAIKSLFVALKTASVPLRGVFHAAGVVDDMVLSNLTEDIIKRVMAPKILGAHYLDEATRGFPLDYFVLFSSFTTEIGNPGQSPYIAANGWLNALAEKRHQLGETALSIEWGAIGDVGMLARNEAAGRLFDLAGIVPLEAEKALSFLPVLMRINKPVISVVDIDWAKAFTVLPWLEICPRFAPVKQERKKDGLSDTLRALFAMDEHERLDYVLMRLKGQLGAVLQIDPETISDNARLSELGIDSLAGVELQMAIRSEFGVDVSLVLLARNETIIELSRSLLRRAASLDVHKALPPLNDERKEKKTA